ncbi:MAG: outer membrane beta-barrel protein [Halieaceae bacterium]|uniref:outer membrane beta-barrel protein n=1 Tax=Haliea alexandrii TaxID=2448162 RepID=UPI000F0B15D2|nr:outer membrane beta-barrel protein [Haliea alexandrii]MCR9184731.1 outer membrane beta-barrel protein [Halieaceae bacterium]
MTSRIDRAFALSALGLSLTALPAMAGEWYLVASMGESTFNDLKSSSAVDPFLFGSGSGAIGSGGGIFVPAADIQIYKDDTDTFWRVGGGYQVNSHFAIEAAYLDAGEADVEVSLGGAGAAFAPVPPPTLRTTVTYKMSGIEVSGLGRYPVTEKFNVFGRLGVVHLERERSSRVAVDAIEQPATPGFGPVLLPGFAPESKDSRVKPLFGVGIQYQILESVAARLEWTRFQDAIDRGNSEEDVDSLTVGLSYRF